jgi:hypothetical protein
VPRIVRLPDGRAAFVADGHTIPLSDDELRRLRIEIARLLPRRRLGPSETKEA